MSNNLRRRITLSLGAAGGGMLAATFLPVAIALADDYASDPGTVLEDLSQSGIPPLYYQSDGVQLFDVVDTTQSPAGEYDVVGQYDAAVSDLYGPNGSLFNQQEVVLTESASGVTGSAPGDEPPIGSVLDTTNFGGGFENEYSDLVGAGSGGSNLITDTVVTPFGDFNIPTSFDAAGIDAANNAFGFDFLQAVTDWASSTLASFPADIPIP